MEMVVVSTQHLRDAAIALGRKPKFNSEVHNLGEMAELLSLAVDSFMARPASLPHVNVINTTLRIIFMAHGLI